MADPTKLMRWFASIQELDAFGMKHGPLLFHRPTFIRWELYCLRNHVVHAR